MTTYRKSVKIHPCKLEKSDLLKLIEIIKETFTGSDINESFEISTDLPDTRISSRSIEGFLENEELPNKFDKLSITIFGRDQNRNIDKSIRLSFYANHISLDVDGEERTWVAGKYKVITDFLKEKRPWFWFIHTNIFYFIEGALSIILLSIYFGLLFYFIKMKDIISSVFMTIAFFILAYIFNSMRKILPYIKIVIKNEKGFFNRENISLIISLLSLIVTIIGVIIRTLK